MSHTPGEMLRQFVTWVAHHWRIKIEVTITDRAGQVDQFTSDYLYK